MEVCDRACMQDRRTHPERIQRWLLYAAIWFDCAVTLICVKYATPSGLHELYGPCIMPAPPAAGCRRTHKIHLPQLHFAAERCFGSCAMKYILLRDTLVHFVAQTGRRRLQVGEHGAAGCVDAAPCTAFAILPASRRWRN
jgi:hypothetical protein